MQSLLLVARNQRHRPGRPVGAVVVRSAADVLELGGGGAQQRPRRDGGVRRHVPRWAMERRRVRAVSNLHVRLRAT